MPIHHSDVPRARIQLKGVMPKVMEAVTKLRSAEDIIAFRLGIGSGTFMLNNGIEPTLILGPLALDSIERANTESLDLGEFVCKRLTEPTAAQVAA